MSARKDLAFLKDVPNSARELAHMVNAVPTTGDIDEMLVELRAELAQWKPPPFTASRAEPRVESTPPPARPPAQPLVWESVVYLPTPS